MSGFIWPVLESGRDVALLPVRLAPAESGAGAAFASAWLDGIIVSLGAGSLAGLAVLVIGTLLWQRWQTRRRAEADLVEREQAALRTSDEQFESLIARIDLVLARFGPDGRILYISPQIGALSGYRAEQVKADPGLLERMVHPDDLEVVRELRGSRARRHPTPVQAEYRIVRQDGSFRWVHERQCARFGPDGSFGGYDVLLLDISDRKRAEQALRESQERFRMVAQATNDVVWDWDLLTNRMWWSEGLRTQLGYATEEMVTDAAWWYEHIHPEDRERVVSGIHALIASGQSYWSDEYRFQRADGSYIDFFDRGYVIHDDGGKSVRMIGAMMDVTERKRALEAVRRERDFLARLLDVTRSQLTDLQDFYDHLAIAMAERLDTSLAAIEVIEGDSLRVISLWERGEIVHGLTAPLTGTPCENVHVDRRACSIRGPLKDMFPSDPFFKDRELRCYAGAPIYGHRGQVMGVACVLSEEDRELTEDEMTELGLFGQIAGAFLERHRAEFQLKESQERLQTIFDGATQGIYLIQVCGPGRYVIESINPALARITGMKPEGKTVEEAFGPEMAALVRQHYDGVVAGRRPVVTEEPYDLPSGRRVLSIARYPIFDPRGEVARILGFVDDVTEAKRAEAALQESQRALSTLMSNLPGMAYRCRDDPEWTMEFVSDGCVELTGYHPSDLVENRRVSYARLIHGEDRQPVWDRVREALAANKPFTLTYRIITADGTEKWVWEQGRGVWAADGRLLALEGFITDISERKRVEEKLQSERDFVNSLIQASPAFFVAIDAQGKTVMMNEAMLRALGYTPEEVRGRDYLTTFVPPGDREMLSRIFEQLVNRRAATLNENRVLTRQGEELLVEWHGRPVFRENGDLDYFFGVGIDITERRRLEEKIQLARKMETAGTLASGIAHDFNNLLTALLAHLTLAAQQVSTEHPALPHLRQVEQVAGKCSQLVRSLLTFSRRFPSKRTAIDLNHMVREAVELLRPVLPAHVQVEQRTQADLPAVLADAGQMHQIVVNLCMNARDAMPEGGKIVIETAATPWPPEGGEQGSNPRGGVRLTVRDAGVGMDEQTRARAFEPFFSTKEVGQGTGLGLSIVYGIVQDHGGQISLDSEPGGGTCVDILLPALSVAPRPAGEPEERAPQRELPVGAVLFADDEPAVLAANASFLRGAGIEVTCAEDGLQALDLFRQMPGYYGVVVLDHKMPRMSGLDCLKAIKQIDPNVVVLLTTGYAEANLSEAFAGAEDVALLEKPYRPTDLLSRIVELARKTDHRPAGGGS